MSNKVIKFEKKIISEFVWTKANLSGHWKKRPIYTGKICRHFFCPIKTKKNTWIKNVIAFLDCWINIYFFFKTNFAFWNLRNLSEFNIWKIKTEQQKILKLEFFSLKYKSSNFFIK